MNRNELVKPEHRGMKIKHEKAFPGRYSWTCPVCKRDNRYFELDCGYCEWEKENKGIYHSINGHGILDR